MDQDKFIRCCECGGWFERNKKEMESRKTNQKVAQQ